MKLQDYLKEHNVTSSKLHTLLIQNGHTVSLQTVINAVKGKHMPTYKNMKAISDVTGRSIEELFLETNNQAK